MCGIAAYAGEQYAAPVVWEALRRLEHRGYDSWGIAVALKAGPESAEHDVARRLGAPSEDDPYDVAHRVYRLGKVAIGHTRWATHGEVLIKNCHPVRGGRPWDQWQERRGVLVVHNGVVENHQELSSGLIAGGFAYQTDTDTETLAHLLSLHVEPGNGIAGVFNGAMQTLKAVKGANAFAAVHRSYPDWLVAGANGSPLCFTPEGHVASDPAAFVGVATKYARLPDGHVAVVQRQGAGLDPLVEFYGGGTKGYLPKFDQKVPDPDEQAKGGYDHFMLKELHQTPDVLAVGRGWVGEIPWKRPEQVVLLGCGSSYNACLLARRFMERAGAVQVTVEYASEFRERDLDLYPGGTLFVGVTQSGETKDTLAAMERVATHREAASLMVVTNTPGSKALTLGKYGLLLNCGTEWGVAATKTFAATVAGLMETAALWTTPNVVGRLLESTLASELPAALDRLLAYQDSVRAAAEVVRTAKRVLVLGKGDNYAVAREAALKVKEVAYIHAEAMPAAEMKHGPIALVDKDTVAVFIAGDGDHERVETNMREVKARGGFVVAVVGEGCLPTTQAVADMVVPVPVVPTAVQPLVAAAALQLLAYHVAVDKGINPDRPRNLAKSVTVE